MATNQMEIIESAGLGSLRLTDVYERPGLIDQTLQEHLDTRVRIRKLGQRTLSPWLKTVIWSLRVYVLFMTVVVIINIVQRV
ncbi:MAG: hypothetical protein ACYCYO_17745 [Bacilli bacterium]